MRSPEHQTEPQQPSTPPSGTRTAGSNRYLKTPVSTHQTKHHPHTPYTPHHLPRKQAVAASPVAHHTRGQQQLQTPDQTPRIGRRKDLTDAIASKIGEPSVLFPLAPSTVGSGRKSHVGGPRLENARLDLSKSYKIDLEEDLQFSSDEEGENLPRRLDKVTKKLDFKIDEFAVPSTPAKQVMTEEQAYNMHIDPQRPVSGDDDERFVLRATMNNPFLESGEPRAPRETTDYSRFEEEVELVNNKTGEKIVRKLTDYEKSIKARRLDFSSALLEDEAPQTPRNNVTPEPFKQHVWEDESEDRETIRKEKIKNPFRGPSLSSARSQSPRKTDQGYLKYVDKTGKAVRELVDEEPPIRPRKLRFDTD
ncbi:hypothetical protein KL933_003095 [Ogataea haglerorum]|uniref:Uncharacterized protein n=1 Tax=Ogataea haglerorum TaxID=1937702 RepID=A0AAN6HZU9_9ASCO|nr:hypothetical protein KL933_003095 [Ogataea haglerorum]